MHIDEIREREARERAEQRQAELRRQLDAHEHAGTCCGTVGDEVPFTEERDQ